MGHRLQELVLDFPSILNFYRDIWSSPGFHFPNLQKLHVGCEHDVAAYRDYTTVVSYARFPNLTHLWIPSEGLAIARLVGID